MDIATSILGFGGTGLVKMLPDQPSVAYPGEKTAISEPMDKFCNFEQIFSEMISYWRYPVHPIEELILKSCVCKDLEDNKFEIKVIYDGDKLRRMGFPVKDDVKDPVRTHYICWYSEKDRYFKNYDLGPSGTGSEPVGGSEIYFHADPLRLEFFIFDGKLEDGKKEGGKLTAKYAQDFFVNPFIMKIKRREFAVEAEAESLTGEGELCALSDPLDELIAYDEVFDGLSQMLKEPYLHGKGKVKEKSETEWEGKHVDANIKSLDGKLVVKVDREAGKIRATNWAKVKGEEKVTLKQHFQVHQQPLRVEFYFIKEDGSRCATRSAATHLQTRLDQIIQAQESGWFW